MTTMAKIRFYGGAILVALSLTGVGGQDNRSVVAQEITKLGGSEALRDNKPLLATLMRNIAVRLGPPYGVLVKTTGNNCEGLACDIICLGNGSSQRQFDVLRDEGGASEPVWNEVTEIAIRECVVPTSTVPTPPVPTPVPVPTPPTDPDVIAALRRIEALVGAISCGEGGLTDDQYANLVRLVSMERPVEVSKGGWLGGTFRGQVGGVK